MKHSKLTANVLGRYGLNATAEQLELLDRYLGMVLEWNAKINLISRRDEENIVGQHLLHSLAPLFLLSIPDELIVMDLGSGGGFPGIPLAILNPGWNMVLVDSIRKKTLALEDMVARLGLGSVQVVTGRVEERDFRATMGGKFDLILARGVASLTNLVVWSRPFVRHGAGHFLGVQRAGGEESVQHLLPLLLSYKGGDLAAELKEARIKAGVKHAAVLNLAFPGGEGMEKKLVLVNL